MVQLGSPRRLKTIFDVNMRATFGAESWRRQSLNRESRPYLMYSARQDRRTRPAHRAMDGQVFRVDDPIWNTHYPPNGWNCRCRVRALTERQVEARGIQVRDSAHDGEIRPVEQRAGKDKRTGEPVMVKGTEYRWRGPDGREHALTPDAGWSYNPGRRDLGAESADRMIAKIDAAPPELARAAIGRPWNNPLFRRHLERKGDAGDWPIAIMPPRVLAAIGGKSRTVRLSPYTAGKQKHRHKDLAPEDYARVQRILDEGELFKESDQIAIGFIKEGGHLWKSVVRASKDGKTHLATLHKAKGNQLQSARRELKRIDQEGE